MHLIRDIHTTYLPLLPPSLSSLSLSPSFLFTFSPSLSLPHSFPPLTFTVFSPSQSLFLSISLSLTYFSLSPTSTQTTRVSLQKTASSLACRGLMHSYDPVHTSVVGGNKWRPLHKPQWIGVNHKVGRNYMYSILCINCTSWIYM